MSGGGDLDRLLRGAVEAGITPGCVALVWRDGVLRYEGAHGQLGGKDSLPGPEGPSEARVSGRGPESGDDKDSSAVSLATIYDLASLTKVLSTTTLSARAVGRGELDLDDRVPEALALAGGYRPTLRDLLEHAAGLEAHREFFCPPWSLGVDQPARLIAAVRELPPVAAPRVRAIYTDLGFLLLGAWLEQLGGARLDELFAERVAKPLGLEDELFYGGPRSLTRSPERLAPTEVYDARLHGGEAQHWYPIREQAGQRVASGLVHDDNCLVMGGVAGHAGLFGTAKGVLELARAWLERRLPGLDAHASARVWDAFTTPSTVPGSTRRLGFDGTNPDGSGSTGTALSSAAIGHLGFTGTSVWIDPSPGEHVGRGSIYVLLTNRVHPTRTDTRIRELRRQFHELAGLITVP